MIHVSVDGGEVWNMAQLPTVNHEQFYSILAANQDMIFMHVDDPEGQKQWRCWEWWWVLMMDMVTTLHADADNYIHFIKVSLIDTNTGAAESFNGLNGLYCLCVCVFRFRDRNNLCVRWQRNRVLKVSGAPSLHYHRKRHWLHGHYLTQGRLHDQHTRRRLVNTLYDMHFTFWR